MSKIACKTKKDAERRGRKLLKLMKTKGWDLWVWKNLGWHYALRSTQELDGSHTQPVIHTDFDLKDGILTYYCLMNGGDCYPISNSFKDPNQAVQEMVDRNCEKQRARLQNWQKFLQLHGLKETPRPA